MIIGIDTRIPTKNKTGIAYILDNLIPLLVDLDKNIQYKFLGSSLRVDSLNTKVTYFPKIIQKGLNFMWKNFYFPPANLFIGKTDVFFFPNFSFFPVRAMKKVLLIPDLSFILFPEFAEKKNLIFLKRNVERAIKQADYILTISENAKNDIVDFYQIDPNKIDVIYLGCPKNIQAFTDNQEIEKIKSKYDIVGQYIFFVGTLEPRKNIEGLIKAYSKLNSNLLNKFKLVICGGKGWKNDKIFKLVEELNISKNVVFTGYVDLGDMSGLYSGASLFVFPSFYEGFGLPVLEAFKCGVPVVLAGNSSLPEVGGDAVVYCNANDVQTIKEGMEKVLLNERLKNELVEKGYQQLNKFSWEKSAEKVLDILNS